MFYGNFYDGLQDLVAVVGRLGIVFVEQDLCKHVCIDLKVDVKMRCAYSIDIAVEVSHLMLSIHIRYTYIP